MDIRISIPPEMQDKLQQRALDCGQGVTEYVERLIEKDLTRPMSLCDLYAPVRRQIEQSGISEDETPQQTPVAVSPVRAPTRWNEMLTPFWEAWAAC